MSKAPNFPALAERILREEAGNWRKRALHPSTDLLGCTRRTCLEFAGAPERPQTFSDLTRRRIGKEMHEWWMDALQKRGFIRKEIPVAEGLEPGWRGSADTLMYVSGEGEFWLWDWKFVSGAQLYFAQNAGKPNLTNKDNSWPSKEYVWQLSAYVHALRKMGVRVDRALLGFWPTSDYGMGARKVSLDPVQVEIEIVPEADVRDRMRKVSRTVEAFVMTLKADGSFDELALPDYLEPEQKLVPKPSRSNPQKYELHQKLDWRCRYCPFFGRTCQPPHDERKLGVFHFEGVDGEGIPVWAFTPEDGVEEVRPLIRPEDL